MYIRKCITAIVVGFFFNVSHGNALSLNLLEVFLFRYVLELTALQRTRTKGIL
jgi:hypothetical protein